jgi:hypothetical protein
MMIFNPALDIRFALQNPVAALTILPSDELMKLLAI